MAQSIEDIILEYDKRGVSALRPHLPPDFCTQAARYIMDHPGNVAIVTGFYILAAGSPETDGPAGAIAIGNALQALGRRVSYVSDAYATPVLRDLLGDGAEVLDGPFNAGFGEMKRPVAGDEEFCGLEVGDGPAEADGAPREEEGENQVGRDNETRAPLVSHRLSPRYRLSIAPSWRRGGS